MNDMPPAFALPVELDAHRRQMAEGYGVAPDIHPADFIFRFVYENGADKSAAITEYFENGATTAHWLRGLIAELRSVETPFSLLEFASGYGRVTRHLPAALPAARIVASDIHAEAMDFIAGLGIGALQSSTVPEQFPTGERFDIIFALSFFTHMPKATWLRWLQILAERLNPEGCLIFTTHGDPGMRVMGKGAGRDLKFDEEGFWFSPMSEQGDLDTADYGSTGTAFAYVYRAALRAGLSLTRFQEAGAGYQDLVILRRPAGERRAPFLAEIRLPPSAAVRGRVPSVALEIANLGGEAWINPPGPLKFTAGARIVSAARPEIVIQEWRSLLPDRVGPGETAAAAFAFNFESLPPGQYRLQFDVVREGLFWFADQGSDLCVVPLDLAEPV